MRVCAYEWERVYGEYTQPGGCQLRVVDRVIEVRSPYEQLVTTSGCEIFAVRGKARLSRAQLSKRTEIEREERKKEKAKRGRRKEPV